MLPFPSLSDSSSIPCLRVFFAVVAGMLVSSLAFASGANLTANYTWKPMKIGGGGWMTGMDISPTKKNLIYARTDVSGAYRWDESSSSWKQIVTTTSMPTGTLSYGNYPGVDSLVGAPSEPNVAYMTLVSKVYEVAEGQIFRSNDQGGTWVATRFSSHKVRMEPNGEGRQEGERLAVDPANSNVVYFGSILDGLWRTEDAGETWTRIESIPVGISGHGVNTITFDPHSGAVTTDAGATKTRMIYVTVDGGGVYQTTDAGRTWALISSSGSVNPGNTGRPRDAALGSDRMFYVVYDNADGATGGIWKYSISGDDSGRWTEITPPPPDGGNNKSWWAVAVNPLNADQVVAMLNGGRCFVSMNQGSSWSSHGFRLTSRTIQWQERQENYWLSMGEITFDPFEPGRLWFAEGFGVWRTDDLTTKDIEWRSVSEGIEEMCGNDVIAPLGGRPVAAMWDLGAFHFENLDTYTARKSHPGFMSGWALDWCASNPKFMVGVFRSHLDHVRYPNSSGYSTDGGITWTRFAALEQGSAPAELEYGVIAVSANNTDKIVWAPAKKKLPWYSTDRGATWTQAKFDGAQASGFDTFPSSHKPLCADRVRPDTFYFYIPQEGVFRSVDGGATFAKMGNPLSVGGWGAILKSTPGHTGHLWFAEGHGGGLWRSTDGGATWAAIAGIERAANVGLGKARTDDDYPTLFIVGNRKGTTDTSIFRSSDEGNTWEKIASYPLDITDWVDAIDGDKEIFGRVYIGFAGAGFAWGDEIKR